MVAIAKLRSSIVFYNSMLKQGCVDISQLPHVQLVQPNMQMIHSPRRQKNFTEKTIVHSFAEWFPNPKFDPTIQRIRYGNTEDSRPVSSSDTYIRIRFYVSYVTAALNNKRYHSHCLSKHPRQRKRAVILSECCYTSAFGVNCPLFLDDTTLLR